MTCPIKSVSNLLQTRSTHLPPRSFGFPPTRCSTSNFLSFRNRLSRPDRVGAPPTELRDFGSPKYWTFTKTACVTQAHDRPVSLARETTLPSNLRRAVLASTTRPSHARSSYDGPLRPGLVLERRSTPTSPRFLSSRLRRLGLRVNTTIVSFHQRAALRTFAYEATEPLRAQPDDHRGSSHFLLPVPFKS